MANKTIWGIHTMDDPLFLNQNLIAIGWEEMGNLANIDVSRDAYKEKYIAVYPNAKKGSIATSAGMLYRFACEVQEGDYIVFPSKIDRKINIGIIESAYYYDSTTTTYPHRRSVKWLKSLPRTAFSQGALHEVGSALSFFQVKNYGSDGVGAYIDDQIHEFSDYLLCCFAKLSINTLYLNRVKSILAFL